MEHRVDQRDDAHMQTTIDRGCDRGSDSSTDADRRSQRRAKTDLFVNRFLNGHPYLCRMTNISRSGARLVPINEPRLTPAPAYMGLQFQLPGRPEIVTAFGETATTEGGRSVGIRFTRLPASAAAAIDDLISALIAAGTGT